MMIIQFADQGNLRHFLSSNFNNILWNNRIGILLCLAMDLKNLHELKYFHKDFHSGNILKNDVNSYVSDFGLSGPSNEQKSGDKICGITIYCTRSFKWGTIYIIF